jgi:hypothetical protein
MVIFLVTKKNVRVGNGTSYNLHVTGSVVDPKSNFFRIRIHNFFSKSDKDSWTRNFSKWSLSLLSYVGIVFWNLYVTSI